MSSTRNQYEPDWVTPPGSTLAEALEEREMTQVDLAERIGMTRKHLKQILDGHAPITPETALKLERVFGIPAHFWNNLEQNYRDAQARQREAEDLEAKKEWLKRFKNIKKMVDYGWLPQTDDVVDRFRAILDFFGVASPEAWDSHWDRVVVSYRKSQTYEPDPYALAAWLRQGELMAQRIDCAPYDESRFRAALDDIRKVTTAPAKEIEPALNQQCAPCGVAVVFVPELPKTASGATRWLSKQKALLQLSLKYKTDDHLWFTFFHEAGHILLHRKSDIFIEAKAKDSDAAEEEANRFAARKLIPDDDYRKFVANHPKPSKSAIVAFARDQGISPGIVVGRLQHDKVIAFSLHNDLKRSFEWKKPEAV